MGVVVSYPGLKQQDKISNNNPYSPTPLTSYSLFWQRSFYENQIWNQKKTNFGWHCASPDRDYHLRGTGPGGVGGVKVMFHVVTEVEGNNRQRFQCVKYGTDVLKNTCLRTLNE